MKNIIHEPTDWECELGHKLRKYQVVGRFSHRILCPKCDADIVEKMRDGEED
jgi:hypothetical protein